MEFFKLSRAVSHALRHEPWLYELEFDQGGWVSLEALIKALRAERKEWASLTGADIQEMIKKSEKKRHEMLGGRIRAFYGHSVPYQSKLNSERPPVILYHGTAPETAEIIKVEGLKPMNRNYVHLSTDRETALKVGSRKTHRPIVLKIASDVAYDAGCPFYHGNETVWLAKAVPAEFIEYIYDNPV